MTAKLWIFGDSYGCGMMHRLGTTTSVENTWPSVLCRELGFKEMNFSWGGASVDHAHWQWYQQKKNFAPEDTVILIPTDCTRSWLDFSDPSNTDLSEWIDHLSDRSRRFVVNLVDPELKALMLRSWLGSAMLHAQEHRYRLVVIPAFESARKAAQDHWREHRRLLDQCYLLNFSLFEISRGEIDSNVYDLDLDQSNDMRPGHLCFSNHARMAELIKRTLTGTIAELNILDMKKEFFHGIFDKNTIYDRDLIKKETGQTVSSDCDIKIWSRP